jgi:hypothetical protein
VLQPTVLKRDLASEGVSAYSPSLVVMAIASSQHLWAPAMGWGLAVCLDIDFAMRMSDLHVCPLPSLDLVAITSAVQSQNLHFSHFERHSDRGGA